MTPWGSFPTQGGGNNVEAALGGFCFCSLLYFTVQVAQPSSRKCSVLNTGPRAEPEVENASCCGYLRAKV